LYDPNGAESTTSDNDERAAGHYTITSAVTSSSSSNDNGTQGQAHNDNVKESLRQHDIFGSPQVGVVSDFPFLHVDSPDFNNLVSPNPDDTANTTVESTPSQFIGTESFDTTFVNDTTITNNDRSDLSAGTFMDAADAVETYEYSGIISSNDEEFSLPSATTAHDVTSVGNLSLEQSMASSKMK
jgi:hypothetical protein